MTRNDTMKPSKKQLIYSGRLARAAVAKRERQSMCWFVTPLNGRSREFTSTEKMVVFLRAHPGCLVIWKEQENESILGTET